MTKLLKAYTEAATDKAAVALARYAAKHPMAACFLSQAEAATLRAAIAQASRL